MRKLLVLLAILAGPAVAQQPNGTINAPIYATGYISQVGGTNVTTKIIAQPNHPTNLNIYTTGAISGTWSIQLPNPAFEGQILIFNCGASAAAISITSSDGSTIDTNLPTSCGANVGFATQFDQRLNIWRSLGANNTSTFKPFTGVASQWPWQLNANGTFMLMQPTFDDLSGWRSGTIGIGAAPAFSPTPLTIGGSFTNGADPDDPSIFLQRTLTGSGNSHAISDYTVFNRPGGNYGGFDFRVSTTGTASHDHIHGFQYRPEFSSSGYMETAMAFSAAGGSIHAGTLNFFKGMEIFSLGLDGGAVVNNEIGIDIHPFANAPSAARSAIQVRARSASVKGDPSYFGGDVQIQSQTQKDGSNPFGALGVQGDVVVVGGINTVWSSTASEPSLNLSSHAAFPRVAFSDDTTGTWNIWPDHTSAAFRICLNVDTACVRISSSYSMTGINDITANGTITAASNIVGSNVQASSYIGWGAFNESFIANTVGHELRGYVNNAAWLYVDSSRNISFPAYTTSGVLTNDASGAVATIVGITGTKTVRASGGASDCTLIFNKGILTGGTC